MLAPKRPYRFGYTWGIVNLIAAIYYAVLAIWTLKESWLGFGNYSVWAVVAVGIGIGLLRRKRYGLFLLNLTILIVWIDALFSWFRPIHTSVLRVVLVNVGLFCGTGLIVTYFYRRRDEFLC
jgi:hypothetical protein